MAIAYLMNGIGCNVSDEWYWTQCVWSCCGILGTFKGHLHIFSMMSEVRRTRIPDKNSVSHTNSATAILWIIYSAQLDVFAVGGLLEFQLNAAPLNMKVYPESLNATTSPLVYLFCITLLLL